MNFKLSKIEKGNVMSIIETTNIVLLREEKSTLEGKKRNQPPVPSVRGRTITTPNTFQPNVKHVISISRELQFLTLSSTGSGTYIVQDADLPRMTFDFKNYQNCLQMQIKWLPNE